MDNSENIVIKGVYYKALDITIRALIVSLGESHCTRT